MDKEDKSGLAVQLEGHVYIVDLDKDGNEVGKTQIDNKVICECLARMMKVVLEDAMQEETQTEEAE